MIYSRTSLSSLLLALSRYFSIASLSSMMFSPLCGGSDKKILANICSFYNLIFFFKMNNYFLNN
nr:MAG TPA: hypothetical protein [Caudoviricetes sp.]DAS40913.1 MAG TPA: hypothetical protein [Caudoviricetes sp.]